MNTYLKIAPLLLIVVVVCSCASDRMSRQERVAAKEAAVIRSLDLKDYSIAISSADPSAGSTIHSNYWIRVFGDSVDVKLPFVGQAFNITFASAGFDFTEPITDYKWGISKKGSVFIDFKVRTGDELFGFNMEVYTTGVSYVTLSPLNRQSNSYIGELVPGKSALASENFVLLPKG